jgi:quercetin dioxygenase-like cupin family protein
MLGMSSLAPAPTPRPARTAHGSTLAVETLHAEPAPVRLEPYEQTLLRVIDGAVRVTIEDDERILGLGDEAIIPAGALHQLSSVAGEARIISGKR